MNWAGPQGLWIFVSVHKCHFTYPSLHLRIEKCNRTFENPWEELGEL
jgi:hypothetical protein